MERWSYTGWQAVPGELYVPRLEAQGYVLIEPNLKPRASPNKRWPWSHWQELVRLMPDIAWLQLGLAGTRVLEGVRFQRTDNFKEAAIIASLARGRRFCMKAHCITRRRLLECLRWSYFWRDVVRLNTGV